MDLITNSAAGFYESFEHKQMMGACGSTPRPDSCRRTVVGCSHG